MAKTLTIDALRKHFHGILKSPLYVHELKLGEMRQVLEYAQDSKLDLAEYITGLISCNSDYNYPEEYLPDRYFDYWADCYSSAGLSFPGAVEVIKAIERALPLNKKFARAFLKTPEVSNKLVKIKGYTKIVLVRSFYAFQCLEDKRISNQDFASKKMLMKFIHEAFPDTSGQAEYRLIRLAPQNEIIKSTPDKTYKGLENYIKLAEYEYPMDYSEAKRRYKEKYNL